MPESDPKQGNAQAAQLKRSLGLVECTLMGVGVMLGAGIYVLVGQGAMLAGNAVWSSFLAASVVAGFTGLSYAELSSFIPKAGGEYYYAKRAFGSFVAFLTTWLLLLGIVVCSATVAIGFAGYLRGVVGIDELWGACLLVAASTALLVYGIKQSAWVAGVCTALELLGLAIIIAVGIPRLGAVNYLEMAQGPTGVAAAAALIFFAFIGFEEIAQLAEETKDAAKTVPRAVLLSIAITTVLYVLVAICAVSVLGWRALGSSSSPLADVASVALGPQAFFVLSVIALFSTGNTVLILSMSAARLLYGMAEDRSLPRMFAKIHVTRQTPYVATLFVGIMAVTMILTLQNIDVVAKLTNFSLLVAFAIINLSVVVLRFREPDSHRPFRIWGSIGRLPLPPFIGVLSAIGMLFFVGWMAILLGSVLTLVGILVYLARRWLLSRLTNQTFDT